MNRYEFENLISDYLEGELSFSKRKEFESYLEKNEDAKLLFFRVKNTLNDMKNAEKISTSENFNSKLYLFRHLLKKNSKIIESFDIVNP